MDFTHAGFGFIKIIANNNFNDGGYVRDLQCWQVEEDAEARHCFVSSYRNCGTVGTSKEMEKGVSDNQDMG